MFSRPAYPSHRFPRGTDADGMRGCTTRPSWNGVRYSRVRCCIVFTLTMTSACCLSSDGDLRLWSPVPYRHPHVVGVTDMSRVLRRIRTLRSLDMHILYLKCAVRPLEGETYIHPICSILVERAADNIQSRAASAQLPSLSCDSESIEQHIHTLQYHEL